MTVLCENVYLIFFLQLFKNLKNNWLNLTHKAILLACICFIKSENLIVSQRISSNYFEEDYFGILSVKNTRAIRLIVVYFFAVLMQAGSLLLLAISLLFFYLPLCTHNMLNFLL